MRLNFCQITTDDRVWQTLICLRRVRPVVQRSIVIADETVLPADLNALRAEGAEVHVAPWQDDFAQARNEYVGRVPHGDWLLVSDSDELFAPETVAAIPDLIERSQGGRLFNQVQFRVGDVDAEMTEGTLPVAPRVSATFYKWLLFQAGPGVRYRGKLHEGLVGSWRVFQSDLLYLHFRSPMEILERACRNFFIGGGGDNEGDQRWQEWRRWLEGSFGVRQWRDLRTILRQGGAPPDLREWFLSRARVDGSTWRGGEERSFYELYAKRHPGEVPP